MEEYEPDVAPDVYVFTDANGDTIIAHQDAIPWKAMDDDLEERYPHLFEADSPLPETPEAA